MSLRGLERYNFIKTRTPVWADKKKINRLYRESKRKGKDYHVDHIVPLVSDYVCGLHNEFNLQILFYKENLGKSNRHWTDMWFEQKDLELECCRQYQMSLFMPTD